MRNLGLSGKKFLLTGASGFLGKEIAKALEEENAFVFGIDIRGIKDIKAVDIFDFDETKEYIEDIVGVGLDGVINCAALSFKGNNITNDQFIKTLEVNVVGTNNIIKASKSELNISASIVNVSSIYGILSPDFKIYDGNENLYNSCAYGASKGAVNQLTRYYATQLAPIRVNTISPGGIFQSHDSSFSDKYSERVPLNRMAHPKEIVDAILFLLSPMSSYITGHNLIVDGGLSAL